MRQGQAVQGQGQGQAVLAVQGEEAVELGVVLVEQLKVPRRCAQPKHCSGPCLQLWEPIQGLGADPSGSLTIS